MQEQMKGIMKNTIVLIVDMQTGLVNGHPYIERKVIENIKNLVEDCRNVGTEIVYVRHDDGPGEELHPGNLAFEIYEELAPKSGDRIFVKHYNSAFYQTGLKEYLEEKQVKNIILVGMQTEYCIDATCKAAFEHGFQVFIPKETNTTFDNEFMSAQKSVEYYNDKIWNGRYATVRPWNKIELFWWSFLCETGKSLRTNYIDAFHFCMTEQLANDLLELVLAGKKTATTGSKLAYEIDGFMPAVGAYSIVTDWEGNPRCVIETTAVNEMPFCEMTFDICKREGEDECLKTWQEGHERFFREEGQNLGFTFTKDMPVVFEDFKVVYKL